MGLIIKSRIIVLVCAAVVLLQTEQAQGAAKHPAPAASADSAFVDGKRVVSIDPIKSLALEMPDGSLRDFGYLLRSSLEDRLYQSGHFVVTQTQPENVVGGASALESSGERAIEKESQWVGSSVPAVTLRVVPQALSFQTGFRGERMFYGFNERFKSQFNDGTGLFPNEFPFRTDPQNPGWFGASFEQKGSVAFGSRSGLDLGDGFGIDVLFAFLSVKYARYHSELRFDLQLDADLAGIHESRLIGVTGEGYYYDVAGGYGQYSGAIEYARRDAMERAISSAISASLAAIERGVSAFPLTAQVDAIELGSHLIYLGTGRGAGVRPGVVYSVVDRPDLQIRVIQSELSGAIGEIYRGEVAQIHPGDLLIQVVGGGAGVTGVAQKQVAPGERAVVATEFLTLNDQVIAKPEFPNDGSIAVPHDSTWKARLKQITEGFLLPYRIWRYFQYDKPYRAQAADGIPEGALSDAARVFNFPKQLRGEAWATRLGFSGGTAAPVAASKTGVIVAVIDSGIDYGHPALEGHVWEEGPEGARVGYDFISGDAKPFDDGYHGTQVASLIAGVAPDARVMSLKVFNPWGLTSSASLLAAFEFALDHGAQIIVCAWATPRESQALELGVKKAQEKGVIVVTSAGDRGGDISKQLLYPASLGARYENVMTVAGVDERDQLMGQGGAQSSRRSGFSRDLVRLAAPAVNVLVGEPRIQRGRATSSDMAAALAAGALACGWDGAREGIEQVQEFLRGSDRVAGLEDFVSGGLRLRFPKKCR